ncbi:hypothetical protein ACJX0J_041342, partial [Zea mays]
ILYMHNIYSIFNNDIYTSSIYSELAWVGGCTSLAAYFFLLHEFFLAKINKFDIFLLFFVDIHIFSQSLSHVDASITHIYIIVYYYNADVCHVLDSNLVTFALATEIQTNP